VNLQNQGITKDQAWKAALNGRGPWHNANTRQMKEAFPNSYFEKIGPVSLFDRIVVKNP
jgi:RNA-directed DNA polymerase